MLCFLTVRRLKPGSYDAFREAWEPSEEMLSSEMGQRFQRAYHLRNLEDENEVVSFGFFEGTAADLEGLRTPEAQAERDEQLKRIDDHVESVGTDAVFEVSEEYVPPR